MDGLGAAIGTDNMQVGRDIGREQALNKAKAYARQRGMAESKIDEVAQEFEAVFLGQMLQHMFAGVDADANTGGGQTEDMYKSLLVDEYGKLMSRTGGIGVADHVKKEMLKLQEVAQ